MPSGGLAVRVGSGGDDGGADGGGGGIGCCCCGDCGGGGGVCCCGGVSGVGGDGDGDGGCRGLPGGEGGTPPFRTFFFQAMSCILDMPSGGASSIAPTHTNRRNDVGIVAILPLLTAACTIICRMTRMRLGTGG
jgi:hypothetical protein